VSALSLHGLATVATDLFLWCRGGDITLFFGLSDPVVVYPFGKSLSTNCLRFGWFYPRLCLSQHRTPISDSTLSAGSGDPQIEPIPTVQVALQTEPCTIPACKTALNRRLIRPSLPPRMGHGHSISALRHFGCGTGHRSRPDRRGYVQYAVNPCKPISQRSRYEQPKEPFLACFHYYYTLSNGFSKNSIKLQFYGVLLGH